MDRYRYHDGEPKGLQFLNDADAKLQFADPFAIDGVEGVVIWGDESSTNGCQDCRQELLDWFNKHSAIFGEESNRRGAVASPVGGRVAPNAAETKPPPHVPRDGPIPKCVEQAPYTIDTIMHTLTHSLLQIQGVWVVTCRRVVQTLWGGHATWHQMLPSLTPRDPVVH